MANKREIILRHYHYDPLDRLNGFASPGQPGVQCFYRNDRLATEIHGQKQYSFFEHESQVLAQQQREAGTVECALQATDFQGSVLHSVVGGQHQHTAYSAYGHQSPERGLISLLGFNGERRDSVTGLYMLGKGHRAFSPVLMQFYSQDRLSPFGKGEKHAYAYCGRDPINRVDPTGQFAMLARGIARLTSAPVSALQQAGKGLRAAKKNLTSIFTNAPTPPRHRSPVNKLIDESFDLVELRKIGDEFKMVRDADQPPPIPRYAQSKGFSEDALFAQRGYQDFPEVQKHYLHSQQPEVLERLQLAEGTLMVATEIYKKKYPDWGPVARDIIRNTRS
ncbi:RHS repeat-associated core domain-containing protein [Pseudomonas sp. GB2N2]